MEYIDYDVVGETATITLRNPELRNALTLDMAKEITEAVERAEDGDARCLVLQGSEGHFCAGGDIKSMLENISDDRDVEELIEESALPVNRSVQHVYECALPTIAKVDGPAFGAGATLALACDVVLASERAEMSFGFRRIGLSVDSGTSYLLPRVVGQKTAMDLVYSGELLDADRAEQLGLISRVFPTEAFEQRSQEYIETVATGPTVALSHSKELLQHGGDRTFDEVIEAEADGLRACFDSEDFETGVQAFVNKQRPEFDGE
ncbi:enoyl-CoA hydratase [Halovenus sp. WSH3]|uniref:Enoyl-CoA hydratase n=1 Tax=Halovenus carboxidivorans TaxID=2692199 RepID=A0A6B0T7S0_9EURY|nr:enoyl-CoA hydratase-related protein [Halovenus carboxidivorans]MXR51342.1 enoyl-CoA hydratase [Halovenus carboxidivorans]